MSEQRGRGRGRSPRSGRGGRGRGNRGRDVGQGSQQNGMSQSLASMSISDEERPITAPTASSLPPSMPAPEEQMRSLTPETAPIGAQFVPAPPSGASPGATFLPEKSPPREPVPEVLHIGSSAGSTALVSGSDFFPPPRPKTGHGTLGRRIGLKINFFEIKIPNNSVLNHYRVEIFDEKVKGEERNVIQKHVCKSVWQAFLKQNAKELESKFPVYDGQSALYSRQRLWGGNPEFQSQVEWQDSEDGGKKRVHLVKIAHTGEVDLSLLQRFIDRDRPYETGDTRQREFDLGRSAIQAIEIILSQFPKSRYTTIGRSHYFDPGRDAKQLGQGCDIWEGYYQSLRPGQWKPFVNIDITYSAILQDVNLVDFICDVTNSRYPEDAVRGRNLTEVKNHLCGLKVSTRHLGYERVYKLNNEKRKVLGERASEHKFQLSDGSTTTTEKYFWEKYKIRLECPNLPQVLVGSKGTTKLPMELCKVQRGQHKKGKLTADQTSEMIKHAAMPANDRMWKIEETSKRDLVTTPLLDHYGIKINPNMLGVEGRVLNPPKITYHNKDLVPKDGSWDLRGVQFKTAMTLDKWVIIDFVGMREDTLYKFLDELREVGRNSGIMITDPQDLSCPRIHQSEDEFRKINLIEQEFNELYRKYNPTMFMIFLNEKKPFPLPNKDMYKHVKRICDYELGVLSQCVKDKNIFKANKSTLANICLKMNAKLGGVNHVIDTASTSFAQLFKKPIMFIGADVNHPHPGMDEVMPSIAAAVGSIDSKLAKYVSSVRFQKHSRTVEKKDQPKGAPKKKERLEMIDSFESMCIDLIGAFKANCKDKLPERIIYYRDGVSEGQFRKVLEKELRALRAACRHFSDEYEPAVTIICVQKRHHLRMFPKNRGDGVGRGNNVPPGCVVDSDVTHPVEFDFYLCSHFGLQGTSKPAHYHVLWDENNFDSDSLQALTYQLCHLYARCTKSVSIPAPVYYAHWVAFRAMMSTSFEEDTVSVKSGGSGGSGDSDQIDWDGKRKKLKIKTGLMYWA